MIFLLVLFLLIDALLLYYLYREAYIVRSNMAWRYQRRFKYLAGVVGLALVLLAFNMKMACVVAGIPAVAIVGFLLIMMLGFMTHKGPWH